MSRHRCPCCGFLTFEEEPPGTFEICPVCFWEDDDVQFEDPSFAGGANAVSLATARENFLVIGVSDPKFSDKVRPPTEDEKGA